jgi:hypothetical protein
LNEFVELKVSEEFYKMFEVVIQLGAILAVILLFLHKLNPFSSKKTDPQKRNTWRLWFKVVLAVVPSAVIGILFDDWMDAHFYNYIVVAITLIVYGIAFLFVEKANEHRSTSVSTVYDIDMKTALLIGCFQCLSLIPGTSRSGATILGALLLGVSRSAGAEFSYSAGSAGQAEEGRADIKVHSKELLEDGRYLYSCSISEFVPDIDTGYIQLNDRQYVAEAMENDPLQFVDYIMAGNRLINIDAGRSTIQFIADNDVEMIITDVFGRGYKAEIYQDM